MRSFTIRENDAGQRMDKFITKAVPLLPKSLMYKYLRLKRIKLNGKRCEISTRLTAGDVVEMYIGDEFFDTAPEESFRFAGPMVPIVYEDEHLLLVNKPAGLVVHEDESQTPDTLIGRILRYLAEKGEYDPATEQSFTPSLCNRIDRNTSGLVICAKTAAALRVMNEKIKLRQIDKRYRCLVHGTPKPAEGRIELFMRKRSDENRIEVFHHPVPDGRTMITEYKVLDSNGRYSLLEVHLITGRTHQIRATMAEIGHPLVGEGKYSSMKNDLGFRFQALCAWSLTFRFEGDSAPLDYLNGRTFTVGEGSLLPAISGTGSDAAMQIHRITARQALNHVGGDPYDYDLNIYRGCAHRCRYCFAIYSQEFLKPQAGETNFFEDIFIKENIVELLERRLASPHWNGAVINIGGVTDSYQPVEAREKRMPEILRLMIRYRNPITISTKSVLMLRAPGSL